MHRSSSLKPIKSPNNSIIYNCKKICSWLGRPKTILEIRKKTLFLQVINNSIIYKFFQDLADPGKKTNRVVTFSRRPLPIILVNRDHQRNFPTIWRQWNTGLVSSVASVTSWGEGASLALIGHPSSDGITIKMPYGVDVLHRPALHPIFSYWVG